MPSMERGGQPFDATPTDMLLRTLELRVPDVGLAPGQLNEPLLRAACACFDEFARRRLNNMMAVDSNTLGASEPAVCIVLDATAAEKLMDGRLPLQDRHVIVLDRDDEIEDDNSGLQPTYLTEPYSDLQGHHHAGDMPRASVSGPAPSADRLDLWRAD